MEYDPKLPPCSTGDEHSFAWISARERWPVILTGAIDDMHKATAIEKDKEKIAEGKKIIESIATMKYEMQHNRKLAPLIEDGGSDIEAYNKELEQRGNPQWHNVQWLYAECYLYRRLATYFATSEHWKAYDVFAKQKADTFRSSRPAVLELAARYNEITKQLQLNRSATGNAYNEERKAAEKLIFKEMCEVCLWGNATDLSLLTNLTYEEIQRLQGTDARKKNEKNIIVNDIEAGFACLEKAKERRPDGDRRVDIVLDNSGFELYVDLILTGYLLNSGLATHIVLHPKNIPWFVSDVTPADFGALLNALNNFRVLSETPSEDEIANGTVPSPLADAEIASLHTLFEDWAGLYAEGRIVVRPNMFWTLPGAYWRLPHIAPDLFADLKESELILFKGDLNYRKLTGDAFWDPTTPFAKAIGPLGSESGLRILALRTCKADVVVGLEAGEDERLRSYEDGGGDSGKRKWAWTGKWAIVSFIDGKT